MAGGNKKYSVVEASNLGFGQVGSIFLDASGAASPPTGLVFIAITFLEDTILDAIGGLVAEDENQYANTEIYFPKPDLLPCQILRTLLPRFPHFKITSPKSQYFHKNPRFLSEIAHISCKYRQLKKQK